jgi:hypothetical protein
MAGLPKKYAKMGFKKGWRAYKASKKSSSKKRSATARRARPAKTRRRTMARKRKRSTRRKSMFSGVAGKVAGALLYGAIRSPVSNALKSVPVVGGLSDEVALGAVSWYLSRKQGVVGQIGNAGLVIEASRLGSSLTGGLTLSGNSSSGGVDIL